MVRLKSHPELEHFRRKSGHILLALTMAGRVGSARHLTDERSNCIISIVLKHFCSHDNILRSLQQTAREIANNFFPIITSPCVKGLLAPSAGWFYVGGA